MNTNYSNTPTINNLKAQTINHFRNAQLLFAIKDAINDFHDGDPQSYRIIAEDFRSGLSIIDTLIVDDSFADQDALDIVFDAIESYRHFISADYKMTARSLSILLSEINNYRAEAYGH